MLPRIDGGGPGWWSVVGASRLAASRRQNERNAEDVFMETVTCLSMFPCLVQEGMMFLLINRQGISLHRHGLSIVRYVTLQVLSSPGSVVIQN